MGARMRVGGGLMLTTQKVLRVLPVQLSQALLPWAPQPSEPALSSVVSRSAVARMLMRVRGGPDADGAEGPACAACAAATGSAALGASALGACVSMMCVQTC